MNPPEDEKQIELDHEHYRAQGLPNEPIFKKGGLTRVAVFFAVLFVMMGAASIVRPAVEFVMAPFVVPASHAIAELICGNPDC